MKRTTNFIGSLGLSIAMAMPFVLTGCQEDLGEDSHYQKPSFLKGNAVEVLTKEGNYKTFLRGIELVDYTDVVDSQILTVLAPTDEAFAAFLKEKGYNSIDEMYAADSTYTRQVITYHLLYYAMDWEKMTNFRPKEGDAATDEEKTARAGMYNRFRTRCAVDTTHEYNRDPEIKKVVPVIHWDRYLTVFSEKMFQTLGIDAASNYNYFFPDTEWNPKHLANGFNVMNAAVLDTVAVVTDNGYLYHIDHVIEPVGTMYDEMKSNPKYQKVLTLFDKFHYYDKEANESKNRGYDIYEKFYDELPGIDAEWDSTSYTAFSFNSFNSFNLFVPTDEAMDKMFGEYWTSEDSYNDIESLDQLIQHILLKESVGYIELENDRKTTYMCYPDYIRQGKVSSYFGSNITTAPESFDVNRICNNGVIYGSDKMQVPDVFTSAVGPVFKNTKYLPYLYTLEGAKQLLSMASKETQYVTLIPDTTQFSKCEPKLRLFKDETSSKLVLYYLQQWNDQEGDFVTMASTLKQSMVNMNTAQASELKMTGTQVVETNEAFNYWYVKDGQITTNYLFNQQLNPTFTGQIWSSFREIKRNGTEAWDNGHAYAYDYPGIFLPASGTSLESELSINKDRRYPYACFVQLLQKASLVSDGKFVYAGLYSIRELPEACRFFVIVPTNDAIKAAFKDIPGTTGLSLDENTYAISGSLSPGNKTALANYLLSYFVTADRNNFTAYPYLGSPSKGEFVTGGSYNLNIIDDGTTLSASFSANTAQPEGNIVPLVDTYSYLPFAFSDGAFQLIDQVLK